ncbi:NADPH:quinone oxidoreductase family protein [Sphingomonas tabacisoli]|uniref:NADPH:quinone oxidoreductase family protein n=1 Tax=Sphingomonas tabacisoli TaxID=2249466 RepID=A0ABW4I1D9_9SPHN
MRALLSNAAGGPETLVISDAPEPAAGPGQVIVGVKACAINYPDVLVIEDKYQFKPPRPFAPGGEIAGVVESVGEGEARWKPGDRVVAVPGYNGLADRIAIDGGSLFRLPEERSFVEGAALLITYGTVIHALVDRAAIRANETLLVLGAAGGVGLAAIKLGKAFGARVVAAVSSEEKAAAARSAGADETVIYPSGKLDRDQSKELGSAFKAVLGKSGADVVFDPVGGDYAEPALRALAWGGRYLVVGFVAGIPSIPLNLALLKSADIRGVIWGAWAAANPNENANHVERLFDLWKAGKISPKVTQTFAFDSAHEAIAKLGGRTAIGKLVVDLDAAG